MEFLFFWKERYNFDNFALSRRKPEYGKKAREVQQMQEIPVQLLERIHRISGLEGISSENTGIGSCITGNKMGDGSAREQAASCQRVIGGSQQSAGAWRNGEYRKRVCNQKIWFQFDELGVTSAFVGKGGYTGRRGLDSSSRYP